MRRDTRPERLDVRLLERPQPHERGRACVAVGDVREGGGFRRREPPSRERIRRRRRATTLILAIHAHLVHRGERARETARRGCVVRLGRGGSHRERHEARTVGETETQRRRRASVAAGDGGQGGLAVLAVFESEAGGLDRGFVVSREDASHERFGVDDLCPGGLGHGSGVVADRGGLLRGEAPAFVLREELGIARVVGVHQPEMDVAGGGERDGVLADERGGGGGRASAPSRRVPTLMTRAVLPQGVSRERGTRGRRCGRRRAARAAARRVRTRPTRMVRRCRTRERERDGHHLRGARPRVASGPGQRASALLTTHVARGCADRRCERVDRPHVTYLDF